MTHRVSKTLTQLLTTSALLLVTVACAPLQREGATNGVDRGSNAYVDAMLVDQGDLTMFYQALRTTGVANEMSNNEEYTILAPTNAAFNQVRPNVFPCFYAPQCRPQLAAILRNHIIPKNESIARLSRWGGIKSLGGRIVEVEEPYIGQFTVSGHRVLYQTNNSESSLVRGYKVSLYRIDGLIANDQEMAPFRTQMIVHRPDQFMEKTVTTYRTPATSFYAPQALAPAASYSGPGGRMIYPIDYSERYDSALDSTTETTTVTHTTTTE